MSRDRKAGPGLSEIFRGAAELGELPRVMEAVENFLEAAGAARECRTPILVAADELYSNICKYSGAGETSVFCGMSRTGIKIVFEDDGIPYDPLKQAEPDVTLGVEERKIGGLGIYMVRKSMDKMCYEYADGKNRLTIIKEI